MYVKYCALSNIHLQSDRSPWLKVSLAQGLLWLDFSSSYSQPLAHRRSLSGPGLTTIVFVHWIDHGNMIIIFVLRYIGNKCEMP